MTTALDIELDRFFSGGLARGRYGRKDVEAAAPVLALFCSTIVPFDEMPESLRELFARALTAAGADDVADQATFQKRIGAFLESNPLHPEMKADLQRIFDRAARGGQAGRRA